MDSLLISEVVDATLTGGLPKFVELTNCGSSSVDLSNYSFGNFNNGGTTLYRGASTLLSGSLDAGSSYVISYENGDSTGSSTFFDVYGFDPDTFDQSAITNGNDVYALFLGKATGDGSDATLVDVYGVIGTDGNNENWEYTDGFSYRTSATSSPSSTFTSSEWVLGGVNSLTAGDGVAAEALIKSKTSPGSHLCSQNPTAPLPASSPSPTFSPLPVQAESKTVREIQGIVTSQDGGSPLVGRTVKIENVIVTGTLAGRGFYVQDDVSHPTSAQDILDSASSGLFASFGDDTPVGVDLVVEGRSVSVVGVVREFFGETQLGSITLVESVGTGTTSLNPIQVSLPFNDDGTLLNADGAVATLSDMLESLEGMLVSIVPKVNHDIVVSGYFNLDRFGEFKVCAALDNLGRIFQYTQLQDPSASGFAASEALRENSCIAVSDGSTSLYPDPLLVGGYAEYAMTSTTSNFRGGDVVETLIGHLAFSFDSYKLEPTSSSENLIVLNTNPRQSTPEISDSPSDGIKLANCNVLNFFTTTDDDTTDPVRGADNALELERQEAKLMVALQAIDADIYGLQEVENKPGGEAASRRLEQLLSSDSGKSYKAVSLTLSTPGIIGTDFIKPEILYDPSRLTLLGASILTEPSELFSARSTNRSPLLASFSTESGEQLDVVVAHLKSKGGRGSGENADQSDGQGSWNQMRTRGIQAILDWIETDPTGSGASFRAIMGDFNAYAKEDPVTAVAQAGYFNVKDLVPTKTASPVYSYLFDGQFGTLDYIFINEPLKRKLQEATTWNINSDELDYFDYNFGFKVQSAFDATSPHRFSDHDPVIAVFDFDQEEPESGTNAPTATPTSSCTGLFNSHPCSAFMLAIVATWGMIFM